MKKVFYLFFLCFNISAFSQAFEKDELIIEVGMGFPNLSYLRSTTSDLLHFDGLGNQNESIHKSHGQFIASSEFLMTDKVGFELGVHYGHYYDYETRSLDVTTEFGTATETYFYEQHTHRLRLYLGMNFHVIRSERLDSYIGVKVGLKKSFINYNSNDINSSNPFEYEVPVGLRLTYGFRYFINQYWGLHAEMGLGGPLITFGLTYKIID